MKKIKYILITLITFTLGTLNINAASATLKVNSSSIENGKSVTATVSMNSVAAWNVTITSSGSTAGCTQKFVGDSGTGTNANKSFSVTCRATSEGIINFSISGDITDQSGSNVKVSGSKSVNVTAPRPKSQDNKLSSLSVSGYEISPVFSKDINEYSVNVPSTIEKITINANKSNTYASVTGAGEQTVEVGLNVFEVIVTSETGSSNIYKLTVNVEDLNPIEVTIDNIKYTVVKELKNLEKPELFEETSVIINEIEIPAFTNEIIGYTLVGLKDTEGKISLFVYKDGKYTKYNEFISDRLSIVFLDFELDLKNYKKEEITINDEKVTVYKNNDTTIVYGMNILTGKSHYYKIDLEDNTIQKINIDSLQIKTTTNNIYMYVSGALGISTLILLFVTILQTSNKKKYLKLIELNNK